MGMSKIYVAGKEFDCDARVVSWHESGWDATAERCILPEHISRCPGGVTPFSSKAKNMRPTRYWYRPGLGHTKYPDLRAAQALIRMFTVHHDGCPNAKVTFGVLHDERGLSCHFIIDNDGTIYQTLDLALMGFHAGGFNGNSVGVELCNRGDAKKYPGFYDGRKSRGKHRSTATCRIHGHVYLAYNFLDEQLYAMKELARALRYALPNLPVEYPQDAPGQQAWAMMPNPKGFSGYMGHYHQTTRKWDPGPFDFKRFCEGVRGALCFPVFTHRMEEKKLHKPEVPTDTEELKEESKTLYKRNEQQVQGGFFPVGPIGESRLWHGGVHIKAERGAGVYAPFAGRLMAARMGGISSVGSTNFALLRHDITVGPASIRFFTLYFHLQDDNRRADAAKSPPWLQGKAWKTSGRPGQVTLLDEPVEAGALLGHVGIAGPDGGEAQIHFEVFSPDDVMTSIPGGSAWTIIDGTGGGRFSNNQFINDAIDVSPKDGKFSRREILDFFRTSSDRNLLHYYAVLSQSEWTATPDWVQALSMAPDFKGKRVQDLVEEQITPTLWWDKKVARHCRLPNDGIVYHYHPISFLKFVNEKLLEANALADVGLGAFKVEDASVTPEGVTDDNEDVTGDSFLEAGELESEDDSDKWPLEKLVEGFPE